MWIYSTRVLIYIYILSEYFCVSKDKNKQKRQCFEYTCGVQGI